VFAAYATRTSVTFKDNDEFLPTRKVRARYGGKSEKTLERWVARAFFPNLIGSTGEGTGAAACLSNSSARAWAAARRNS
jgi:hypothetical protein